MQKIFVICLTLASIIGLHAFKSHESASEMSDLTNASAEALTQDENPGVSNTGPREKQKCFKGGTKMVCMCVNTNPCTDTDCF